jgi:hypothetical protein
MKKLIPVLLMAAIPAVTQAAKNINFDSDDLNIDIGGFIRADAGIGDRYGDAHDDDRIAISKSALAILPSYKNVKGVFVVGGELSSVNDANNDEDGNIDIKDAYITLTFGNLDAIVGAAPLLFGLKGEGYPGDHTIQPSVEFGGGGAFAVSNQAGPSVIADWKFMENASLRVGVFDQKDYQDSGAKAASDPTVDNGSGISDNVFIQVRGDNLMDSGVYASAGYETRYVGDTVDDSKDIWAVGAGWKSGMFDISAEYQSLDEAFNATADDESYVIVEALLTPADRYRVYLDYSKADELDVTTWRAGANYDYNKHTVFSIEYSKDDLDTDDESSVDARIALSF